MKPSDHAPGYVPNAAYSQADWDEVSDNPELSAEQLAQMHLGSEGLPPDLAAALDQCGRRMASRRGASPFRCASIPTCSPPTRPAVPAGRCA